MSARDHVQYNHLLLLYSASAGKTNFLIKKRVHIRAKSVTQFQEEVFQLDCFVVLYIDDNGTQNCNVNTVCTAGFYKTDN